MNNKIDKISRLDEPELLHAIDINIQKYRNEFHIFRNYSLLQAIQEINIHDYNNDELCIIFAIIDKIGDLCVSDPDKHFIEKISKGKSWPIDDKMQKRIYTFLENIKKDYSKEKTYVRLQQFEW